MLRCTPFLLFDGNCAEAMTFYHKCLGGSLTLTKLDDTPMKHMLPPDKHERIINGTEKRRYRDFCRGLDGVPDV
jgi:PhnB protein